MEANRLQLVSTLLTRQIKSTVPYAIRASNDDVYPFFVGTGKSMTFVTTAGRGHEGGLTRVVYRVEKDPARLVVEEDACLSRVGGDVKSEGAAQSTVLLGDFRNLEFLYGAIDPGEAPIYRRDWSSIEEESIPGIVRIRIDGLPSAGVDRWGFQVPIMVTLYGGGVPVE